MTPEQFKQRFDEFYDNLDDDEKKGEFTVNIGRDAKSLCIYYAWKNLRTNILKTRIYIEGELRSQPCVRTHNEEQHGTG